MSNLKDLEHLRILKDMVTTSEDQILHTEKCLDIANSLMGHDSKWNEIASAIRSVQDELSKNDEQLKSIVKNMAYDITMNETIKSK